MPRTRRLFSRATGYAAERSALLLRSAPGVTGALLVSFGGYLAWHPLGFIAAGGFLLLLDRRVQ